jgi:hypothetical protein
LQKSKTLFGRRMKKETGLILGVFISMAACVWSRILLSSISGNLAMDLSKGIETRFNPDHVKYRSPTSSTRDRTEAIKFTGVPVPGPHDSRFIQNGYCEEEDQVENACLHCFKCFFVMERTVDALLEPTLTVLIYLLFGEKSSNLYWNNGGLIS